MTQKKDEFYSYHDYSDHINSATMLARILDDIGFSFYWATDGPRFEDYLFHLAPDVLKY